MNSSELMPVVARALVDCDQSMPTAKLTEFTEALTEQLHASFPITVRAKPKPKPPAPPRTLGDVIRDAAAVYQSVMAPPDMGPESVSERGA